MEDLKTSPVKQVSIDRQFVTFYVGDQFCGIDVNQVQEIIKPMSMTKVPLSPSYVVGLINLRGQIATAIDAKNLLNIRPKKDSNPMNVICNTKGGLLAFLVDEIGDVLDVNDSFKEPMPESVPDAIRRFTSVVFKTNGKLMSVLEPDQVLKFIHSQK